MLLLATVLADLYLTDQNKPWRFILVSTLTLIGGVGLSLFSSVSKNLVSASYVLISLGICALVFTVIHWLVNHFNLRFRLLTAWGKNPLLLYLLHFLLLGVFFLPGIPTWYTQAHWLLTLIQLISMIGILSWIAVALEHRNFIFSL